MGKETFKRFVPYLAPKRFTHTAEFQKSQNDNKNKNKMKFYLPKEITHSQTKAIIKDHVKRITAGKQLNGEDIAQLHRMAIALDTYFACTETIFDKGATMINLKGETVKRPEINIQREAWAQYFEILKEYGLTKKSKKQIEGNSNDDDIEDSPLYKLLKTRYEMD